MNSRLFSDAMSEIDTRYIDQVLAFRPAVRRHPFRQMPEALIAAVLALLLMGTRPAGGSTLPRRWFNSCCL